MVKEKLATKEKAKKKVENEKPAEAKSQGKGMSEDHHQ